MASLLLGKGVFPFGFQDASEDLRYVTAFVKKDVPAVFCTEINHALLNYCITRCRIVIWVNGGFQVNYSLQMYGAYFVDWMNYLTPYAVINGKIQLHFNVKSVHYFLHKALYNSISQYDDQRLQWNKLLNVLTIQVTSLSTWTWKALIFICFNYMSNHQ